MSAPPKKSGMSLYADLLGSGKGNVQSTSGATISSAPVKYDLKKANADEEAKKKDASLQFQPIRRPQAQQKNKAKSNSSSSAHKLSSSTATASTGLDTSSSPDKQLPTNSNPPQPRNVQVSSFGDWVGGDDEDSYYERPRHERGGRKKRKKNKLEPHARPWGWDDIYDPALPNNYSDYRNSEEQAREISGWKDRLYFHRRIVDPAAVSNEDEEDLHARRPMNRMFAPPSNMSFAPPSSMSFAPPSFDSEARPQQVDDDDEYYPPPPPPPPPTAPPKPLPADIEAKKAAAAAKIAEFKAKMEANKAAKASGPSPPPLPTTSSASPAASTPPPPPLPDPETGPTISRAPVRYTAATTPNPDAISGDTDVPGPEKADAPRSSRPGQQKFAERLMKKYGWEKGQGLGAQGEGITTALTMKADKRKRLPDAEGGGWASAARTGKIVGGKKRKIENTGDDDGTHGIMSQVVKFKGMLEGLDVDEEIQKEKSLYQEIGEYMDKEYGKVERVFVWRPAAGGNEDVFVKFTAQLSALRAVNDTDGMTFAGNHVVARFFDGEKFEAGEYA